MTLDLSLDIVVTCVECGEERDFPERAQRVLEADATYADVDDPCECGSKRIRVEVKLDASEDVPQSGAKAPQRE